METIIPVRLQDCDWNDYTHDGVTHRVEGECDTSKCKAMCCQVMNWRGRVGERCEFLQDDLRCMFHAADVHCKPISCYLWPTKQVDIDSTNALAERFDMAERCLLKVVEVGNS